MKTPEDDVKKINVKELTVKANPNPGVWTQLTLQIQSDKDVPVTVKVTDINGRLISLQPVRGLQLQSAGRRWLDEWSLFCRD